MEIEVLFCSVKKVTEQNSKMFVFVFHLKIKFKCKESHNLAVLNILKRSKPKEDYEKINLKNLLKCR